VSVRPARVALVGHPNCGKTALFNLLTGSRQKIGNYAGVTVERKEGRLRAPSGRELRVLDLPGAYSLNPRTPDEAITADVVLGRLPDEPRPDLIVAVVDAANLRRHLRFVRALVRVGHPVVVALNMVDLARRRGLVIDAARLADELGVPVVETVGVRRDGAESLIAYLDAYRPSEATLAPLVQEAAATPASDAVEVDAMLDRLGLLHAPLGTSSDRIDRFVLHPLLGPVILSLVLFATFQAVFTLAQPLMQALQDAVAVVAAGVGHVLPQGLLRSLIVDGVLAGAGSVLVFLPQIALLFAFILVLEDSGYLPRAAFLLDRLMGGVGLSGRSFIPLLSSFACAVPGVMAARTIPNPRDRLVTILIAPLMTCSARLPVYALLIGAFIPPRTLGLGVSLQGFVLFVLYVVGIASAFLVAFVCKLGAGPRARHPLQMELPTYHWPSGRHLLLGLWQRIDVFLRRVGTTIVALMVLLWFLASFPGPPAGATEPAIVYSIAGRMGFLLAHVFAPIGFNWQISLALVPGLAAREVAVGALGTVYALSSTGKDVAGQLAPIVAASWSLPTALALLAWYVYAPQCISTLAVVQRETNSWRYPALLAGLGFLAAYLAAGATFHVSRWLLGVP
jgi:ferrous iron transport protein B